MKSKTLAVCTAMALHGTLLAQPGTLDASFNPTDTGFGNGDGPGAAVRAIAVQPDGRILIGGWFYTYHGTSRVGIARANADGTLDNAFVPNAAVWPEAIALQPDGKIVLAGEYGGSGPVQRLNADGSLDMDFAQGSGANGYIHALALQPDGRMLVGGQFTTCNGIPRNGIARLNTDGSLDLGFDIGSGMEGGFAIVRSIAVQADGRILAGGQFTTYNGVPSNGLVRLNSDGSLDTSFNTGTGMADGEVFSLALQPTGEVYMAGTFWEYNGIARSGVARLNADGTLDMGFDPGTGVGGWTQPLIVQPDGKVLIGGSFTEYDGTGRNSIARLNADGSLDTGFDPGSGANGAVNAMALLPDGKILAGGGFTRYDDTGRNYFARLNADGTLDNGFNPPGTGVYGTLRTTTVQPDGKILAGGRFSFHNGTARNSIARLNADGTLDATFDPGVGPDGWVLSTVVQPDGRVLIGGNFTAYGGVARRGIARLNTDGTLDTGFDPGTGIDPAAYAYVAAIALQPDGKILIAGVFMEYDQTPRNGVARLNTDGSLDASFDPGMGANAPPEVACISLQADGRIIIGGNFTFYDGTFRNRIARLNADGSLDTTFGPGAGADAVVLSTAVQPDGRILVGGNFTAFNNAAHGYITRLNADGSLDPGFDTGTGLNSGVGSILLQPPGTGPGQAGKIIIGGGFTIVDGISRPRIARLEENGQVDAGFDPGTGANSIVYSAALQPDGKILIGGIFTAYDGTGRNRLARIIGDISTGVVESGSDAAGLLLFPNPATDALSMALAPATHPRTLTVHDATGRVVHQDAIAPGTTRHAVRVHELAPGLYTLRIAGNDGVRSATFIKAAE